MQHGASSNAENPHGIRRKLACGLALAPRYFRKKGKHFMSDVTDAEIAKVYFDFPRWDEYKKSSEKSIQSYKGQITKLKKSLESVQQQLNSIKDSTVESLQKVKDAAESQIKTYTTKISETETKILNIESERNSIQNKIDSFRGE